MQFMEVYLQVYVSCTLLWLNYKKRGRKFFMHQPSLCVCCIGVQTPVKVPIF